MLSIIAKDNKYLKLARSLQQKKGRTASGCFLIEGIRLAEEAAACGLDIRVVFVGEAADSRVMALVGGLETRGLPVYRLSSALLSGITATEHSQGIVLIAGLPQYYDLPGGCHCYALCDRIADPGNLGGIIRSAYAAGVAGLMLLSGCADPYNPKTVRAAMGALFRLPVVSVASAATAYQKAREIDLAVYVTAADGEDIRNIGTALTAPHLWILGSEAEGVSDFWRERSDLSVCIPMQRGAESLNVGAAAAVLFYQSFFCKNGKYPCP